MVRVGKQSGKVKTLKQGTNLESCGPSNKEGGEPEFLVLEKILHIHLPKTLTLNHLRFHRPGKFAPNRFTSQSEQVRQLRSIILRCSAASVDMSFSPTEAQKNNITLFEKFHLGLFERKIDFYFFVFQTSIEKFPDLYCIFKITIHESITSFK